MGFFKKKVDPISERAQALNDQIAALEEEIARLSAQPAAQNHKEAPPTPTPTPPAQNSNARAATTQPRLRSTALPHGHGGSTMHAQLPSPPPPPQAPDEPVFEEVNPFRPEADSTAESPERHVQLGVREDEAPSIWKRIKNNFKGPPTSNPKLVNYLAAGSIQGLRPLRYEKRVARNRFILLVIVLAVVLWGIVAAFIKR